jgi:hypothetical protein
MLMRQHTLLTSIHGRSTGILGRTLLRNINADKSPIIFMADEMDCLVCEFRLIDEMINDSNTTQALDRFNSIQNRIPLNDESSRMEYDAYELYLNLRYDMIVSGNTWQTITSDQLNTLCDVSAAFTTWAGVQAVGILNAHFTKNHIIPPAFKNEWNIRSFEVMNSSSQSPVIAYPNPADESINLEIKIPFNEASFVIYDSMNRLINEGLVTSPNSPFIINSGNWESGIYYYLFTIDHKRISGKIEIIHWK